MRFFILMSSIFYLQKLATGFNFYDERLNVEEAVNNLNSIKGSTWTAGKNNFNQYITRAGMKSRLGGRVEKNGENLFFKKEDLLGVSLESDVYDDSYLPEFYDAREMYPQCSSISHIRNQANCGSCWAVATAAAYSDRLCISSKGLINIEVSSSMLAGCANQMSNGCNGGYPYEAWEFIRLYGVVTGSDYDSEKSCQPYPVRPCGDLNQLPCFSNNVRTPKCIGYKCSNEWHNVEEEQPYTSSRTLKIQNNETIIREEIYNNGTVTAAFDIYTPFYFYTKGVFQLPKKHDYPSDGSHIIRIIGWGVEQKVPYWLCANSWGENWGEGGTFKILRGKNHCGLEEYVFGGTPILPT